MWKAALCGILGLLLLAGCGDESAEQPLKMPKKEETWVKTEHVDTTKEDALAPKSSTAITVPINEDLWKTLTGTSGPAPKKPIADATTCLALLDPLDKMRMLVQREGGAWSIFERSTLIKSYSDNGMQIDSNLNKLVFSLRHLCQTAEGVPLNPLAIGVNEVVKKLGKEQAREHLIEEEGEAPEDVDLWLEYAEFANKNATRKVPYSEIQALILKIQPLMDLYQDLLKRKVTESNKDEFLSDSLTLLTAVNSRLTDEPNIVMAMKEDTQAPLHTRWEM